MLTALLLVAVAPCPTGEPRSEAGLRAAEADWVAAIETRDAARLSCRLAEDFADSSWQGRLRSRADMIARLASAPPMRLTLSEVTVRLISDIGIVNGINTQSAPGGGQGASVRFTDIFVWRAGHWQAVAAQETLVAAD